MAVWLMKSDLLSVWQIINSGSSVFEHRKQLYCSQWLGQSIRVHTLTLKLSKHMNTNEILQINKICPN